jgi:hypothetical protein
MNQKITEVWGEAEIVIVKLISSILPNEFLFSLFYLLAEWKQKITLVKLCKILNVTDQKLIRDHLNMLLKFELLDKTGEQYQISSLGKQGFQMLNDHVGKIPNPSWIVSSAAEIVTDTTSSFGEEVIPEPSTANASGLVRAAKADSLNQRTISDSAFHDDKVSPSSESTIILGGETLADAA